MLAAWLWLLPEKVIAAKRWRAARQDRPPETAYDGIRGHTCRGMIRRFAFARRFRHI